MKFAHQLHSLRAASVRDSVLDLVNRRTQSKVILDVIFSLMNIEFYARNNVESENKIASL